MVHLSPATLARLARRYGGVSSTELPTMVSLGRRGVHILRDMGRRTSTESKPRLIPCTPSSTDTTPHAESSRTAEARYARPSAHQLSKWTAPPQTILLIQKPDDARTKVAMGRLLDHLHTKYPHLRLLTEPHTAQDHPSHASLLTLIDPCAPDEELLREHTDLVITVGGDGTILHTSNLFGKGECPPVVSFSMGSLGFLLPFHIDSLDQTLHNTLTGPISILNRMRLACTPFDEQGAVLSGCKNLGQAGWQVMNEVTLHRAAYPQLAIVDAYFDGEHLTEAVADGLLLSTPTGSTAYSLSAGGPISHPEADAFLLTPIAPRSLSFRTVILPGRGVVRLEISPLSRSPVELSIDGRTTAHLTPKQSVVIAKSPYPIPCVERNGGGKGWVRDINSLLQFNVGFRNKSLHGHIMG